MLDSVVSSGLANAFASAVTWFWNVVLSLFRFIADNEFLRLVLAVSLFCSLVSLLFWFIFWMLDYDYYDKTIDNFKYYKKSFRSQRKVVKSAEDDARRREAQYQRERKEQQAEAARIDRAVNKRKRENEKRQRELDKARHQSEARDIALEFFQNNPLIRQISISGQTFYNNQFGPWQSVNWMAMRSKYGKRVSSGATVSKPDESGEVFSGDVDDED